MTLYTWRTLFTSLDQQVNNSVTRLTYITWDSAPSTSNSLHVCESDVIFQPNADPNAVIFVLVSAYLLIFSLLCFSCYYYTYRLYYSRSLRFSTRRRHIEGHENANWLKKTGKKREDSYIHHLWKQGICDSAIDKHKHTKEE